MVGTVIRLRRYPVKSMLGQDVAASAVTRTGLAGDRRLAVVSRTTGKIASAKYPRLWRDLLTLSAEALDEDSRGEVRISLPGGKTVQSTGADADAIGAGSPPGHLRRLRAAPPADRVDACPHRGAQPVR